MDHHSSDNLPPELDELGTRMNAERPVASDRTLDGVMMRASGALPARKPSLLWRSTAPRARRKGLAAIAATVLAAGGAAGLTVAGAGAAPPVCASGTAETIVVGVGNLANISVIVANEYGPNAVIVDIAINGTNVTVTICV